MSWLRITFLDTPTPTWARELNTEADRLDPHSEPNTERDYDQIASHRRYEEGE